jgi:hypothetical protein
MLYLMLYQLFSFFSLLSEFLESVSTAALPKPKILGTGSNARAAYPPNGKPIAVTASQL